MTLQHLYDTVQAAHECLCERIHAARTGTTGSSAPLEQTYNNMVHDTLRMRDRLISKIQRRGPDALGSPGLEQEVQDHLQACSAFQNAE